MYNVQYLHPYVMEGYREAARALRAIGKDCIQKRIQALEGGQPVPHDILTCILKTASKYQSHILKIGIMVMTTIFSVKRAVSLFCPFILTAIWIVC